MRKHSTRKRVLHMAAAAAAVATFGVACGEDDGINDDPFDTPEDPLAPSEPGVDDPMDDPFTTDDMGDDLGG